METKHAWYILSTPSPAYSQIFKEFELTHELTYLLLSSCLQDHQVTSSAFKKRIQREYPPHVVQSFEDILGNKDKVSSMFMIDEYGIDGLQEQFIVQFLMDFSYQRILNTPLVQELFPQLDSEEDPLEETPVLDQPPMTIITPRIDQVCGRLFKYYQNFRVEGNSLVGVGSSVVKKAVEVHGAFPEIRWVSGGAVPGYHESVRVDNGLYQVSTLSGGFYFLFMQLQIRDIVLVEPEEDYDRSGATSVGKGINPLANQYWYFQCFVSMLFASYST